MRAPLVYIRLYRLELRDAGRTRLHRRTKARSQEFIVANIPTVAAVMTAAAAHPR